MKTAFAGIVISTAVLLSAGEASATPFTFTYKGIVSYGADMDGVFGTAGADLGGKSFEVVETFDLDKATGSYSGSNYQVAYGGSAYGSEDFATSKIKIGSSAFYTIKNDFSSLVSVGSFNQNMVMAYKYNVTDGTYDGSFAFTSLYAYAPSLSSGIQPTTILFDGTTSYGAGSFYDASFDYNYDNWTFQNTTHAYAGLNLQSLTISAVPLPASAPMFGAALLGLGAVGFGIRRRKVAAAT